MTNNKLSHFMYGLLYPAVLGSVMVALGIRFASPGWADDQYLIDRVSLGTLFLVFFCVSFVNSMEAESYGVLAFLLDSIEVALMFLGFSFLRLLSMSTSFQEPMVSLAYLTLLSVVLLQQLWRIVAIPTSPWRLPELRIAIVVSIFLGIMLHSVFALAIVVVSVFISFLIGLYLFSPAWYLAFRKRVCQL